jgi:hypothetical protein
MSPFWNRNHQAPVRITDDLHVDTPFGHRPVTVTSNLKGASGIMIVTNLDERLSANGDLGP